MINYSISHFRRLRQGDYKSFAETEKEKKTLWVSFMAYRII